MRSHPATLLALLLAAAPAPAFAVETEVLFDGASAADWTTARDESRLAQEFSVSELTASGNPPALQWRFAVRDAAFNDLFLMRPIARRFTTVRVRIRNEGAGFELACKARDANGAEWTANRHKLEPGGDWQWVEFPAGAWTAASWSRDEDGKLDFPLASFTLIALQLRKAAEYQLRIGRIEIVRPDPPVATLAALQIPPEMHAGRTFPVSLTFSVDRPVVEEGPACLEFRRGERVEFQVPLPLPEPLPKLAAGREVQVEFQAEIPRYAFGGPHRVALRLGEARVRRNGAAAGDNVAEVHIHRRAVGKCAAAVKTHRGTPTLFINGQPHNGMAWATYRPTPEVFRDFTRAGVTLFTFAATPTESGYNLSRTAWTAPDTYDFSQLDERALMLLRENPDAYFFPRLYLHAPKWWSERHPDDVVLMDPGDGKFVPFIHSGGKPAPSWASETWRRDTIEGLRRLIAHVEASPYADRVIGYHLASGTTEEWMMWGGNENQWVDFSPVNTARFRKWLRQKYGSDAALRSAWNNPPVTLDTASIPTKAQRLHTELGILRDPAKEQAVIDFYLYNSELVADTLCTFASAVKEITRGEKIVGSFYGYLLQLCGEQRQQNAGHLALAKVLACQDLDFLTSPTSYAFRQLGGEGTSHFMSLAGSVKLHGKLWFDENDIRTSLAPGKPGTWGKPADVAGDIVQQEKELANVIVNGSAQWWFDVGANVYSDPSLMSRIASLAKHASRALELDRHPVDEVALAVDEKSLGHLRVGDAMGARLLLTQLPALSRIGAPVGHYLTSDLPRLKDRKLFLIPTSFAPSPQDRAAIEALKGNGRVLVFLYAPGLYRNGRIDEAAMTELTGIRLKLSQEEAPFAVKPGGGHPLTQGLEGQPYGDASRRGYPVCYAEDPSATVLGTFPDGKPGLAVKQGNGWTSVFSSAPMLPTRLLRNLAQAAGVHLYLDTEDVVWASRDLLGICVKDPGPRTIRLPGKATVRDLDTGELLGNAADFFQAGFAPRATRVFVLERP